MDIEQQLDKIALDLDQKLSRTKYLEGTPERNGVYLELIGLLSKLTPSIADYLDLTIDQLLRLSHMLEEDDAFGRPNNEDISFDERQLDPLANPLQIKFRAPKKNYFSPEISDILADLCQALVIFRESGNTEDFFETLASPFVELAPKKIRNRLANAEKDIIHLQDWLTEWAQKIEDLKYLAAKKDAEINNLTKHIKQLETSRGKLKKKITKLAKLAYSRHRNNSK